MSQFTDLLYTNIYLSISNLARNQEEPRHLNPLKEKCEKLRKLTQVGPSEK